MLRVYYTHRWSAAFFVVLKPILFVLIMVLPILLLESRGIDVGGLFWLIFFADVAICYFFINPFLHTFSTYLYIRRDLKIKIPFREAKKFVELFEAVSDGWYPLEQIKELPDEKQRRLALYDIYIDILRKQEKESEQNKSQEAKSKKSKLEIFCPQCGRQLYGASQDMIGDTGVCTRCKAEFVIEQNNK